MNAFHLSREVVDVFYTLPAAADKQMKNIFEETRKRSL